MEMNNIPWSPVLRYATPLPMNRTPVSTVALQHKSVSSVLRYATPLPINMTLVSIVGGPIEVRLLRFVVCQTPPDEQDPVSTMPIEHKVVCSVLRYMSVYLWYIWYRVAPGAVSEISAKCI